MGQKKWQNPIRTVFKIVLTVACVLTVGFIFSNSLKTAAQSTEQSSTVVDAVQKVAQVIAPESKLATATGEEYDVLHGVIRAWAHFAEFFLLGALLGWCYCTYTMKWKYLYIPACVVCVVPIVDELLQLCSDGRGTSVTDVLTDMGGGAVGLLCALASVALGIFIYRRSRKKDGARKRKDTAHEKT